MVIERRQRGEAFLFIQGGAAGSWKLMNLVKVHRPDPSSGLVPDEVSNDCKIRVMDVSRIQLSISATHHSASPRITKISKVFLVTTRDRRVPGQYTRPRCSRRAILLHL